MKAQKYEKIELNEKLPGKSVLDIGGHLWQVVYRSLLVGKKYKYRYSIKELKPIIVRKTV